MPTAQKVDGWSNTSAGQFKDLFRQCDDGSLTYLHIQALLEHRDPFVLDRIELNWAFVYEALGLKTEFAGSICPERKTNLWAVPVIDGVTNRMILAAMVKLGVSVVDTSWVTKDLVMSEVTSARNAWATRHRFYQVFFYRTIAPDPHMADLSYAIMEKKDIACITLLEHLLLSLAYLMATGELLGAGSLGTLCAGSKFMHMSAVGDVPLVYSKEKILTITGVSESQEKHMRGRQAFTVD